MRVGVDRGGSVRVGVDRGGSVRVGGDRGGSEGGYILHQYRLMDGGE